MGGTSVAAKKAAALTVERRGNNEDGSALYVYTGEHVLLTGAIRGTVTLVDGTVVDVSPDVIAVASPEQAAEVAHHIAVRHEEEGHPAHTPTARDPHPEPFVHLCTPSCGEAARDATDPMQALALVRAQRHTDGVVDGDVRNDFAASLGTAAGGSSMALAGVAAENAALNGLDGTGSTNVIPDVSLHTASPSTTGANENANSGGYVRQACSWNAAASGTKTNSSSLAFSTGGTVAVTHFGTWSSATYGAGSYAIGGALASAVTAASITVAAGAITLSAA